MLREHRDALLALLADEAVAVMFPDARPEPTGGAGRTREWPARSFGTVPPDFDRLVPAREMFPTSTTTNRRSVMVDVADARRPSP